MFTSVCHTRSAEDITMVTAILEALNGANCVPEDAAIILPTLLHLASTAVAHFDATASDEALANGSPQYEALCLAVLTSMAAMALESEDLASVMLEWNALTTLCALATRPTTALASTLCLLRAVGVHVKGDAVLDKLVVAGYDGSEASGGDVEHICGVVGCGSDHPLVAAMVEADIFNALLRCIKEPSTTQVSTRATLLLIHAVLHSAGVDGSASVMKLEVSALSALHVCTRCVDCVCLRWCSVMCGVSAPHFLPRVPCPSISHCAAMGVCCAAVDVCCGGCVVCMLNCAGGTPVIQASRGLLSAFLTHSQRCLASRVARC